MTTPTEIESDKTRRANQLRHDVDDLYDLLHSTNKTVASVVVTQQRHGRRLEEIQQSLDVTVGKLERLEQTQHRLEQTQQEQGGKLDRLEQTQQEQGGKLDAILALLRGGPGSLEE